MTINRRSFVMTAAATAVATSDQVALSAVTSSNLLHKAEWAQWSPRPEIAPDGKRSEDTFTLAASRFEQYGKWKATVPASAGQYYRITGRYRAERIADVNTSVAILLTWWNAPGSGELQRDYVDNVEAQGPLMQLTRTLQAPEGAKAVSVELILRWCAGGQVTFSGIALDPVTAPAPRIARLATTRITPPRGATLESNRRLIAQMAERVGEAHPDLVLFTENLADRGVQIPLAERSEPIPGPTTQILSEWAKRHRCYMAITLHEVDRGILYNTAVLIDREGQIAGKYRKVHLAMSEAEMGITPGSEFVVVRTDIGKVGILTCWDNWFVESTRVLRSKGAEIILLPLAGDEVPGHYDPVTRARALDNGVYLVSSSTGGSSPSRIITPAGEVIAELFGSSEYVVREVDLSREWRVKYLSSNPGKGEGRVLYMKERRAEVYRSAR